VDMTSFRYVDLLLNTRRPGLNDVAVRRALASAVDRNELIGADVRGAARPQVDAEPAGIAWLGPPAPEQPQPALAARALDAAGWLVSPRTGVRTRGGDELRFALSVPDASPLPEVAGTLATQLEAVGVALTVTRVAPAAFEQAALRGQSFDMALVEWDS